MKAIKALQTMRALRNEKHSTNILFVTQRLSDFVEMRRASSMLKKYGYKSIILFCGVGQKKYDNEVIREINKSINKKEIDGKIIKPTYLSQYFTALIGQYVLKIDKMTAFLKNLFSKESEVPSPPAVKIRKKRPVYLKLNAEHRIRELISATKLKLRNPFGIFSFLYLIVKKLTFIQFTVVPLLYYMHLKLYKEVLREYNIKLIILPEDIVGFVSPLLIRAGHIQKIPSLILPYTIANQTEAFQSLKKCQNFSTCHNFSNRLVGRLFRTWIMKDDEHKVLRLPAGHVIGHILTRSSPPDPWMMNSGYANLIAVENEKMLEYYYQNGIPLSKMRVVGACYDDYLAHYLLDKANQCKQLYAELKIKSEKPILLIGGFPNQLIGNPPGFDFKDVEEAVDFISECLHPLQENYEVIFRPHPNYLELSDLFAKRGYIISTIDTARLVALADAYIAFASATIRWAIVCGVPCINYDIFHYDFSDYKAVQGVLNVCKAEDFRAAINTLSDDRQFTHLKESLDKERKSWGTLDGQSVSRINTLIQELLQLKFVPRTAS